MRKFLPLICLLAFFLAFSLRGFQAGASRVSITPEKPVPLAGYGARLGKPSRGILDPVYVRALVLDDGKSKIALVSADILLILADLKKEVEEKVKNLGLDGILLGATHTHSGPGGYSDIFIVELAVLGGYKPWYREFLVNQMAKAIREAKENLKPARLGSVVGKAPGFNINRRDPEGPTDPALGVIKITDFSETPIAYLINYTAHPTCLSDRNMKISGDWVGVLEREIEEKSPPAVALFFNGALGDQAPNCGLQEKPLLCRNRIGKGIAEKVWELIPRIQTTEQVNLKLIDRYVPMPSAQVRKGCWGILQPAMKKCSKKLLREKAEFMLLEINDILIYASPAELAVEVGLHLKAQHPDKKVLVFAHGNDWQGYLLTPEEYEKGGYEACMSLYGRDFEPYFEKVYLELESSLSQ